jgi:hypothetical protein
MGLKVFDLQCEHGHVFEGWFGSREEYDAQQARGLVTCPVCQSAVIEKKLSAPRLNVGHYAEPVQPAASDSREVVATSQNANKLAQLQALVLHQMRELVSNTENVGERFVEEARRIHAGESDERPIRGIATREERESLAEEGIAVVSLPDFLDVDRLQ